MSSDLTVQQSRNVVMGSEEETEDFVTFKIGEQLFGVPVLKVRDILILEKIAFIPLAPPQVTGSINLRGHIVTVIDVRVCLGLAGKSVRIEDGDQAEHIGVTIEKGNDLYTLLVDEIGEVLSVTEARGEPVPNTLDDRWREFATGVYQLEDELLIILDSDRLTDSKMGR